MSDTGNQPRAHGKPISRVLFRRSPEDFMVDEGLLFDPEGEGEHVYLHIRKRNTNTQWLARALARFAGIPVRDVGYAGLKDRHAVTSQWFSLLIAPSREPDWSNLQLQGIEILDKSRHRCKLRPGMLKRNQFVITLHETECTEAQLSQRLQVIERDGVPNYFGEQRFGHDGDNLRQAQAMFAQQSKLKSRQKRGLYLSAARSYLFNRVLAERVRQNNWHRALPGDCMMLDGSNSFFKIDIPDAAIQARIEAFDIHPSGPLWGKGEAQVKMDVLALETKALEHEFAFRQGLELAGLSMGRRALRLRPVSLRYVMKTPTTIEIRFSLATGQYATSLLHELFETRTESGIHVDS